MIFVRCGPRSGHVRPIIPPKLTVVPLKFGRFRVKDGERFIGQAVEGTGQYESRRIQMVRVT